MKNQGEWNDWALQCFFCSCVHSELRTMAINGFLNAAVRVSLWAFQVRVNYSSMKLSFGGFGNRSFCTEVSKSLLKRDITHIVVLAIYASVAHIRCRVAANTRMSAEFCNREITTTSMAHLWPMVFTEWRRSFASNRFSRTICPKFFNKSSPTRHHRPHRHIRKHNAPIAMTPFFCKH